jgi:hypothetical protein
VEELRAYLDTFWNQALAAFKRAVEQDPKEEKRPCRPRRRP